MRILIRLWRWICGLFLRRAAARRAVVIEDLPDDLDASVIYVVGEGEHIWQVAMLCPCGCGETLHMPVLADSRPQWRYTIHEDGSVTLFPSVWRKIGCQSHFHVRRGQVVWCGRTA